MITARSYCTGYTGLEMAVRQAFGDFEVLSHSDIKPAAVRLLEHHYPDIPNLGDMRAIDYTGLRRAELMIGSWPCQPHSSAGKRLGEADPRDLWPEYLRAIDAHRPAIFFGENVNRITSNGELRRVATSLAERGYVGSWVVRTASDVGACHKRARCFVVAVDPAADALGQFVRDEPGRGGRPGRPSTGVAGDDGQERSIRLSLLPTPTQSMTTGAGTSGRDGGLNLQTAVSLLPTPNASDGQGGIRALPEKRTHGGKDHGPRLRDVGPTLHESRWGKYAAAIERHERVLGRAPSVPTLGETKAGKPLLNAAFVEWMMMLPFGHVDQVPDLTRTQKLSLLGDGVVPAQGGSAFRELLDHLAVRLRAGEAA